MAWIEQTKKGSIKSGGPQYYLQDLAPNNRELLRSRGRCPVRLWTPYGVTETGLTAVSSVVGRVGHDRVQSGRSAPSIALQIARWYGLKLTDIERIEFEDSLDRDSFVIRPSRIRFRGSRRSRSVYPDSQPLTLTASHQSDLLVAQLGLVKRRSKTDFRWVASQVADMVAQHDTAKRDIDERDLLRTAGALHKLGIELGVYRARDVDCPDAQFRLAGLPPYSCPIEIEERSRGFLADHHRRHRAGRIVVLCMHHDAPSVVRGYVDVLELRQLDQALRRIA